VTLGAALATMIVGSVLVISVFLNVVKLVKGAVRGD
jgi:hypothetical protein